MVNDEDLKATDNETKEGEKAFVFPKSPTIFQTIKCEINVSCNEKSDKKQAILKVC